MPKGTFEMRAGAVRQAGTGSLLRRLLFQFGPNPHLLCIKVGFSVATKVRMLMCSEEGAGVGDI